MTQWVTWLAAASLDVFGVVLTARHCGVERGGESGAGWWARLQTRSGDALRVEIDAPLAIALVDAALDDSRGPGRRVRPLGEMEHGLLLAQTAGMLARLAAAEPELYLRVEASAPGRGASLEGPAVTHVFQVTCGDIAGDVRLSGAAQVLPGPTVVVTDEVPEPGDLLFGASLGRPRPRFAAFVLADRCLRAQWVQTTDGPALRVLGGS